MKRINRYGVVYILTVLFAASLWGAPVFAFGSFGWSADDIVCTDDGPKVLTATNKLRNIIDPVRRDLAEEICALRVDLQGCIDPGVDMGTPIGINFNPQTFIVEVLVEVLDEWLVNPNIVLHIEIDGLNGGYVLHGTADIPLPDTTVFFTDGTVAQTVVDWTADTNPQHVNEVYTVCVQVLESGVPVGAEKCQQFGPF